MIPVTTKKTTVLDDQGQVLSGSEEYPIIGNLLSKSEVKRIWAMLKGKSRFWNCIEKAMIVKKAAGENAVVVIGSLMVRSINNESEYGYYYNPPYEFHAWVCLINHPECVLDLSLPGVIEKGLNTFDHVGPSLVNRQPVILAGKPLSWMRYESKEVWI